ncbi:heme exporter protein CcmD [Psychrosphaera aestuarii]|uniref:heme exporter protein CcmD n=1 Tax=Psychrosphaera aestuarii TaxID=1266052 RepID=UPI001B3191C4|nr:heme exporter protein CcmD [Psychrosphaera aestuarii]
MQFDSFVAFLDMGGYGFFVWLSYGFSLISLTGLIVLSRMSLNSAKKDILTRIERDEKLKRAVKNNSL